MNSDGDKNNPKRIYACEIEFVPSFWLFGWKFVFHGLGVGGERKNEPNQVVPSSFE
jgi:hypothetical protein